MKNEDVTTSKPNEQYLNTEILDLKTDNDFNELIKPLFSKEYKQLEENLITYGCREPIIVWNGTIIDGHIRYEICRRRNISFKVIEKSFESKEDAIIWICQKQLSHKNVSEERRKYLIGKQYEATKLKGYKLNIRGNNQYMRIAVDESETLEKKNAEESKFQSADKIGDEYHISKNTVKKYSTFMRALDIIKKVEPLFVAKILLGKVKISHDNLIALSCMSSDKISHIANQITNTKNPIIHYKRSRTIFRTASERNNTLAGPSTINSPKYDLNDEITNLTLTIQNWTISIEQICSNTNFNLVSSTVRNKLIDALNKHQYTVSKIYESIDENQMH